MNREIAWHIHSFASLTSTMDVAAELARQGALDKSVVVSAEQTAGRGRAGRTWHSPPGAALYCTLILRPTVPPHLLATLPLLAGVAVAEAIEALCGYRTLLKWPNDVWLGSDPERQKVAGILMTSAIARHEVGHVLIGIGVNVATLADDLPPGGTSILAATGAITTPDALLTTLLQRMDYGYAEFQRTTGHPSLESWRQRAALIDTAVTIEDGGRERSGIYLGIDDDGALLLREAAGVSRVMAGDLVRGPRTTATSTPST